MQAVPPLWLDYTQSLHQNAISFPFRLSAVRGRISSPNWGVGIRSTLEACSLTMALTVLGSSAGWPPLWLDYTQSLHQNATSFPVRHSAVRGRISSPSWGGTFGCSLIPSDRSTVRRRSFQWVKRAGAVPQVKAARA